MNKKTLMLLVIIYLAFISLGLPDGILGVAWPAMRADMGLPLESVGIIMLLLPIMSSFSSFVSGRVIARFGTGKLTFISGVMTGLGLLGYSLSPNMPCLLLCAIPLGFGQGAVDSGLNLYVAQHFSSKHMNWLHCFWGAGASLGPFIMTMSITRGNWRSGYVISSGIQLALALVLGLSLTAGLWRDEAENGGQSAADVPQRAEGTLFKLSDQCLGVLIFFCYSGVEASVGGWTNSMLVESRGLSTTAAGLCMTAFFAAIMAGRFLSGMVVVRLGNLRMVRLGIALAAVGIAGLWCCGGSAAGAMLSIIAVGMGLAPIYPCIIHETPSRFTKPVSTQLIGYEVGTACLGNSLVPAATGIVLSRLSLEWLLPIIMTFLILTLLVSELLARHSAAASSISG